MTTPDLESAAEIIFPSMAKAAPAATPAPFYDHPTSRPTPPATAAVDGGGDGADDDPAPAPSPTKNEPMRLSDANAAELLRMEAEASPTHAEDLADARAYLAEHPEWGHLAADQRLGNDRRTIEFLAGLQRQQGGRW